MAKQKNQKIKNEVVKPIEKQSDLNENIVLENPKIETTETKITEKEVIEKVETKGNDKVWVKDWRELVEVEGTNQTQKGKEYYGVKRT